MRLRGERSRWEGARESGMSSTGRERFSGDDLLSSAMLN